MSGKADSKQMSGPTRSPAAPVPAGSVITTGAPPRRRSSSAAFPNEVTQPRVPRAGTYSPNGTSRILSYRSRVSPAGPTRTAVLKMPGRSAPRASTFTRSGASTTRASSVSRAASSGRPAGSEPMPLSPQTTRSTRCPASERVSSSARSNRRSAPSGPPKTPGCTRATRTVPRSRGAPTPQAAAPATSAQAASPAIPTARSPGTATSRATAVFVATTSRDTSHTPPTEASRSAAGTSHWLAPSSPHGPPKPSQDRTSSISSQPEGTASRAAAARAGDGTPPSRERTSKPHGSHSRPSSAASGRRKTCRLGSSQWWTARTKPAPPSQPSSAARRAPGAVRMRSSHGTSDRYAHHQRPGAGKASAGSAPQPTASRERPSPRRRAARSSRSRFTNGMRMAASRPRLKCRT
ncbi:hypothetical protein SNARM312S_08014 [Streptomyces narbonensis]